MRRIQRCRARLWRDYVHGIRNCDEGEFRELVKLFVEKDGALKMFVRVVDAETRVLLLAIKLETMYPDVPAARTVVDAEGVVDVREVRSLD